MNEVSNLIGLHMILHFDIPRYQKCPAFAGHMVESQKLFLPLIPAGMVRPYFVRQHIVGPF